MAVQFKYTTKLFNPVKFPVSLPHFNEEISPSTRKEQGQLPVFQNWELWPVLRAAELICG